MNRVRVAAVSVVVVLAVVLAHSFTPHASPDIDRHEDSKSTEEAYRPNSTRRQTQTAVRSLQDRPFTGRRQELERRATAGDRRAAGELGAVLAKCNRFVSLPDEEIERQVVEIVAIGISIRGEGRKLSAAEILARAKLAREQRTRDCYGVEGFNQDDAREEALRWIEKGAALGDPDAQAMYGELAFSQFNARSALADAEGIRERKQRAIDYLQSSLAQGDALALLHISSHFASGDLFPASAETSYAYLYAYSLTSRSTDLVPELLEQMLASRAAQLDQQSMQHARDEGTRLAKCCSAKA